MIRLKYKWMIFFKSLAVSLGCCAIIAEIGYYYLFPSDKAVQTKEEKVPYSYLPENAGLMFDFSGKKTYIYLDFDKNSVSVIFTDTDEDTIYGFPVDYTVEADYNLLGGIVDAVGGIDLAINNEPLTYTGVQIVQVLSTTPVADDLRSEIVSEILYKISQNGFLREDFLYIIENSNTNLTVPDCYYWQDSLKSLCKTVRIIN